jgi:hypothetical protein
MRLRIVASFKLRGCCAALIRADFFFANFAGTTTGALIMSKKLKVVVVSGKNLQAKNKGTSSPYCEVRSFFVFLFFSLFFVVFLYLPLWPGLCFVDSLVDIALGDCV